MTSSAALGSDEEEIVAMQTQPLPGLFATFAALFLAACAVPTQAAPPNPILYATSTEYYSAGGKTWVRYRYDVLNKEQYPADMFAAAPNLPPCGANANSSRTWVDFFDGTGRRIYGFCALGSPDDLGKIWFAMEEGVVPPSWVYIELIDRQTNMKYRSALADMML